MQTLDSPYLHCPETDSQNPNPYFNPFHEFDLEESKLYYSDGKFLIDEHEQCYELTAHDKINFNERVFIEYFHALKELEHIEELGLIWPYNSTSILPCEYQDNSSELVYNKILNRVIIGAELITLAGASVAVSKYLSAAIGVSVVTALSSYGISSYYGQNDKVDDTLSFLGKISQATLKHIAFYEIATNEKYKEIFRDSIVNAVSDWRLKYLFDISYFMAGNVVSNWISHSLTDLYNELVFDDNCHKLKIEQEPFMYRGPITAYKRFWKEIVRDVVTFPFLYVWGDVNSIKDYAHIRIKEDSETLEKIDRPVSYNYLDDTSAPSLMGHFAANVQVSSWYNGITIYNTFKTFYESCAKYLPEILLSKYVFVGLESRYTKYFKIAVSTASYNMAKKFLKNWL